MSQERRTADRVAAFSDAVVAIAITLLVLPLTDIEPSAYDGDLGALLSDNATTLWAFVVSFTVIGAFWLLHHRNFDQLQAVDGAVLLVNMCWLFGIAFLPFPTALVQRDDSSSLTAFYVFWLLIVSILTKALSIVIARRPDLHDPAAPPPNRFAATQGWLLIGAFTLALVLVLARPSSGLWPLVLVALVTPAAKILTSRTNAS